MPLFPSRATSLSHHLSLSLSPFIRLPCLATWNILIPPLSPPQFHSTIMIVLLHLSNFDRLIPRPLFSRDGGGGGGTSSLAEKLKYLSLSPPPSLSPFPPPSPYLEYESPFYPATVKNAASLIQPCRLE